MRKFIRAFIRALINLATFIAALAGIGWVITLHAYHHASRGGKIGMLVGVIAAAFLAACFLLYLIPTKEQLKKRQQKRRESRPAAPYATSNRGR